MSDWGLSEKWERQGGKERERAKERETDRLSQMVQNMYSILKVGTFIKYKEICDEVLNY